MKTQKQQAENITVTIRAPRVLIKQLEQMAVEGDRSLNAQIVRMLRERLETDKG